MMFFNLRLKNIGVKIFESMAMFDEVMDPLLRMTFTDDRLERSRPLQYMIFLTIGVSHCCCCEEIVR